MKPVTKILGLDFDGVINSDHDVSLDRDALRSDLIALINSVLDATGAVVLITSDWRLHHTVDQLTDMLRSKGFTGTIIGTTSRLDFKVTGFDTDDNVIHSKVYRADLVLDWLKDNGMTDAKTILVDDVQPTWDDKHPLFDKWVLTDGRIGVSPLDAQDLIKLLGLSNREPSI